MFKLSKVHALPPLCQKRGKWKEKGKRGEAREEKRERKTGKKGRMNE